ncbi:MAG: hypothetical protein DRQ59_02010, partial [Gammaproteobacteria bacterium]
SWWFDAIINYRGDALQYRVKDTFSTILGKVIKKWHFSLSLRERAGVAYMDVGKGREQERKLEGVSLKASPSSLPSPPRGRRGRL